MFGLHASDSVVNLAVHRGQYLNDPTGPTVQGRKCQLLLGPKQDCLTDLEPVICHGEAWMATHDAPRNDSASGAGANAGPACRCPSPRRCGIQRTGYIGAVTNSTKHGAN